MSPWWIALIALGIIVFFVICVAAAEVAVGLAILIALWRHKSSVNIDTLTMMKW